MKITNIQELNEAIESGYYDTVYIQPKFLREGTIIDEDKSVRWNREEVMKRNAGMKLKLENNRKQQKEKELQQTEDIIRVYANDSGYTEEQVRKIYNYAYVESHSYGIHAVLQTLDELMNLMGDVGLK